MEMEFGVQLIMEASGGWGFAKDNPASPTTFASPPGMTRARGAPEGSGRWGRPPRRPRGR